MKNVIVIILLLLIFPCFGQVDGKFDFDEMRGYRCKYNDQVSTWTPIEIGDTTCTHQWAYAKYCDLNDCAGLTKAIYCDCPCPSTELQGRVCIDCKRHERRTKKVWYDKEKIAKSKYKELTGNGQ